MKLGFLLLVIRYVHLGTLMWPLLCSTNHFYHCIHHIFDKMIPVDSLKVSQYFQIVDASLWNACKVCFAHKVCPLCWHYARYFCHPNMFKIMLA